MHEINSNEIKVYKFSQRADTVNEDRIQIQDKFIKLSPDADVGLCEKDMPLNCRSSPRSPSLPAAELTVDDLPTCSTLQRSSSSTDFDVTRQRRTVTSGVPTIPDCSKSNRSAEVVESLTTTVHSCPAAAAWLGATLTRQKCWDEPCNRKLLVASDTDDVDDHRTSTQRLELLTNVTSNDIPSRRRRRPAISTQRYQCYAVHVCSAVGLRRIRPIMCTLSGLAQRFRFRFPFVINKRYGFLHRLLVCLVCIFHF